MGVAPVLERVSPKAVPSRGCCAIFRFALESAISIGGDAGGAKVVAQKPG